MSVVRGRRASVSLPSDHAGADDIVVSFSFGDEVKFSLQTNDPSLTKRRHAAASDQLERLFAAHRNGPQPILHKERIRLAGIAYQDWAQSFEEAPGEPEIWQLVLEANNRAASSEEGAEKWFGETVDELLARECIVTDLESRKQLIKEVARAQNDAATKLKRNAEGDYAPDPAAARFPERKRNAAKAAPKSSRLSFDDLLDRWKRENKRAASSIVSFTHHVADFKAHLGHNDVLRVTKPDVVAWKDKLLERGLRAKTINGSYLASISALYNLAKRDDLAEKNPTEGVRIPVKKDARDPLDYTYTDTEVAAILALSDAEVLSYLRWVPWLTAFTGARVSEIVQLWGKHVEEEDGIHFLNIAPTDDGGTLKTGSSKRKVPLHPAILDRGFLDFVATRNGGPLFYGNDEATPRRRKSETASHASKGPANRVREWIRANGFTDPLKAPNHAFRYWFKFKCGELDIPDSVANAIQGHTDGSVATRYRGISLAKKAEAMAKIMVPTR